MKKTILTYSLFLLLIPSIALSDEVSIEASIIKFYFGSKGKHVTTEVYACKECPPIVLKVHKKKSIYLNGKKVTPEKLFSLEFKGGVVSYSDTTNEIVEVTTSN
ncbi:hypothetical protein H0A36_04105 [Endozoicomonas sp. SM1973]|uniref:Uncharacterized protein n=1 Tax=Spartinivicinus marinus TaxID=2994442 RepID=A0A853HTT6_9GAMM|nr:hypothetical protein [Spartinivicinus marinus]MCX4025591.1 hypothetical protein [Spartinivicinus marinus]NYZ65180.1 hypothetical protein [Spartinivicinus marinus]